MVALAMPQPSRMGCRPYRMLLSRMWCSSAPSGWKGVGSAPSAASEELRRIPSSSATPSTGDSSAVANQHRFSYDNLERQTAEALWKNNVLQVARLRVRGDYFYVEVQKICP